MRICRFYFLNIGIINMEKIVYKEELRLGGYMNNTEDKTNLFWW
ncbi:hypothetical protein [Brachyspira hyodysenteriae]|nr:hypothetical protein [Brachyspira hyodysenteriae]MCZ9977014.1 hypothetical protein [Brachyspira hyodysenteriae]